MITNAELANQIALAHDYLKDTRVDLNERPDREGSTLMPVDVRLDLALRHLSAAVELLRRPETNGISLAFTAVGSTQ